MEVHTYTIMVHKRFTACLLVLIYYTCLQKAHASEQGHSQRSGSLTLEQYPDFESYIDECVSANIMENPERFFDVVDSDHAHTENKFPPESHSNAHTHKDLSANAQEEQDFFKVMQWIKNGEICWNSIESMLDESLHGGPVASNDLSDDPYAQQKTRGPQLLKSIDSSFLPESIYSSESLHEPSR
ncbi:uncharacterized protein NEMAJ01_1845 [Nematocida major]|uniref:uncharacterized protein n=1 Tax=Nematocida major TaxID=1912982 RepID=UPI0020080277|nr:uncharacterized protein NEMAJ01_1845 [Nematocida major]KAH9386949.1 hypothetical protein NEMAJ01_1845 [Nematocida major]